MTARFKKTAAVVVAFILVMLLIWQGVLKYPDIKADYLESARRAEIYDLSAVDKAEGFHARMDTLMAFVHNNSVHNIDDEFWDDFRNKPRTLDKLLAHARGESTEKPHMECSTRSKLLLPLARKAGFEGHMVDMFKYHPEYLSHTVVEVKNPETGLWELYDPTYQIFWKNEKTGGRASIHDLVMEEGPFLPCHAENRCGYGDKNHDHPPDPTVIEYFAYTARMDDEGLSYDVVHNPARFALDKIPPGGKSLFCGPERKRWCPDQPGRD